MDQQQQTPRRRRTNSAAEIRALLEELRRQNQVLKWYQLVCGAGIVLLLLLQFETIRSVLEYAMFAVIVVIVLLTAPTWSRLVTYAIDRTPWFKGKK